MGVAAQNAAIPIQIESPGDGRTPVTPVFFAAHLNNQTFFGYDKKEKQNG
jgi:hypothetical protein